MLPQVDTMTPRLFPGRKSTTFNLHFFIENDIDPVVVSIKKDQTIGMLKKCIYDDRKTQLTGRVDATDLILFKVRNIFESTMPSDV